MIDMPNLILVTGNGRNIGKTTLVESLIQLLCLERSVFGLKVIKRDISKSGFHGDHSNLFRYNSEDNELVSTSQIEEETLQIPGKDTARMIKAGAKRAWIIEGKDIDLVDGIFKLSSQLELDSLVVCESAILRQFVKPKVMVAIKQSPPWESLKEWKYPFNLADIVIEKGKEMPDYNIWAKKVIDIINLG